MPHSRCVLVYRACALAVVVTLAACSGDSGAESQGQQQQESPPVAVDVNTIIPHTVDVTSEYPGRVQGARTVQVLARVEGILLERHYEEGQIVEKGDLLATIDPKPFQATVNQRKAELSSAKASLNQAQRTWRRVHKLYEQDAVSEAERDEGLSKLETARASVEEANAHLDSAQIDLSYTEVRAPLSGVTSLRETDEGSLVSNGSKLTTITQLDPVHVLFALPEDDAIARRKALAAMGEKSTDERSRDATILLPGGEEFPATGTVDFTQSTINPETGTVQLRAVVQNTDNALMPGRYVRTRINLDTHHNAIVVPEVAISDGDDGTQVLVADNGKAKAVKVELGPEVKGGRLVKSGLSGGEQVIVSGLGQVKPEARIKIKSDNNDADSVDDDPKQPNGDSDTQPTAGESAAVDGQPRDDSFIAGIDNTALRLSPRKPQQKMPALPSAQTNYRLDDTVAANVGQGG